MVLSGKLSLACQPALRGAGGIQRVKRPPQRSDRGADGADDPIGPVSLMQPAVGVAVADRVERAARTPAEHDCVAIGLVDAGDLDGLPHPPSAKVCLARSTTGAGSTVTPCMGSTGFGSMLSSSTPGGRPWLATSVRWFPAFFSASQGPCNASAHKPQFEDANTTLHPTIPPRGKQPVSAPQALWRVLGEC